MEPKNAEDHILAEATKLVSQQRSDDAIAVLQEAASQNPSLFRTGLLLSKLLFEKDRFSEAANAIQNAERADPLQDRFQRISKAMQSRNLAAAQSLAQDMLAAIPGHPRAIFTLASIAQSLGDHEQSIEALRSGLAIGPGNIVLRQMLVGALEDAGELIEALEQADLLAKIDESFVNLMGKAGILFRIGHSDKALDVTNRALEIANSNPQMLFQGELLRAQLLRVLGQREGCLAAYKSCLGRNPFSGEAWWGLADLKTYQFSDEERNSIAILMKNPRVDAPNRCMAAFALAKSYEGDPVRSIKSYKVANKLHPASGFDPEKFAAGIDNIIRAFDEIAFNFIARSDDQGSQPIFIVGMPRSGSTLIEQILASHSQIEGTVESPLLPSVKRRAHRVCKDVLGGDYLGKVGMLPTETLAQLGETYLRESGLLHSRKSRFFTDKLPFNFEHVGLIRKILPRALIIDARRNPLDCGLSNFRQYFAQGASYSYDLSHIGAYYRGYLRLMDHWDSALPGAVFKVQYENLVRSPKETVSSLLEYIGLPFEEACLNHHETSRPVRSASSEQVRQPIYASGIGMWNDVESELQPLKDALGEAVLTRFEPYLN